MNSKNDIIKLVAGMLSAVLLTLVIGFLIFSPSRPNPDNKVAVKVDSAKLLSSINTKPLIASKEIVDSADGSEAVTNTTPVSVTTTSSIDNQLQNLAELTSTSSDEGFNTILNIAITNSYTKPLSNIQLYISQDGNSFIPDDVPENSAQLINIELSDLAPGKQKVVNITSHDKGNKSFIYAVNTRKVRFSDGALLTK